MTVPDGGREGSASADAPAEATAPAGRPSRDIVSFVRRGARLSSSRQDAWDRLAGRYVLDLPRGERDTLPEEGASLDLEATFGRRAPLVIEVGSGLGENIAAAASAHPERDHLAVEVYLPGLAQTLDRIERAGLPDNVRLLPLDAQRSLPALLPAGSVQELWVFFPDPWHKSRHHKRRLVNPPFLDAMIPLLAPGAVLRLATDWAQYAHHMRQVLDADPRLRSLHPDGPRPEGEAADPVPEDLPVKGWAPRFEGRVKTSFENKGARAGRLVWDLAYTPAP
ncbi:tRNA (guanosine(46)-N7)-methyltransferase TrmB [Brachybacterium rhamnosum]